MIPTTDIAIGATPVVSSAEDIDHPLKPALGRGWRRTCPNCGSGSLMQGYLKVADSCSGCDQAFHHHRADDGPAYLTILIVGHIMAPLLLVFYSAFRPEPFVIIAVFSTFCVGLSLYLLPRIKGAMIGFQWAKRMHGFGTSTSQQ